MGKVITELSVSLDGFVAGPNDSPELPLGEGGERLFQWYNSGDTPFPLPGTGMVFMVSRASAEVLGEDEIDRCVQLRLEHERLVTDERRENVHEAVLELDRAEADRDLGDL